LGTFEAIPDERERRKSGVNSYYPNYMVPEYEGRHQPKTQMRAGAAICLVSLGTGIFDYLYEGSNWFTSNMLFFTVLGAWVFNRGQVRKKAADAKERAGGDLNDNIPGTASVLPKGAIARRKLAMYVGGNLGIVVVDWNMFRSGLRPGLLVAGGLISFVLINALIFFIFRRMGSLKT